MYNTFLYIGPGLGVGAVVLIVLILLLIVFSFGYRLWYSIAKAPKIDLPATQSKGSSTAFSWEFYATIFTALLIITTFNPSWLGVDSSGRYNTAIQGMPIWVRIVTAGLIIVSMVLILRNKAGANAKETSGKRMPRLAFTPLNVFLILAFVVRAAVIALNEPLSDAMMAVQGNRVAAYFIAALAGLLLGQAVLWMKDLFFETATSSVRLLNVLFAPSDDPEKINAMNAASSKTTGVLARLVASLVIVVITVYGLGWELPRWLLNKEFSTNWTLLLLSLGSVVPFFFTKNNGSAYSDLSQLFHHLVLDNYHLGKKLLNYQIMGTDAASTTESKYSRVLITGLARSGTTALTKELAKRGPFASLDYSNMPVLLAPKLWAKFYKPKRTENKERAHGDGVKVGLASVEALEEYFFKVIKNDSYIKEDGLYEHDLSTEENELYRRYQNSISRDKVYLAKNNNAILRLKSLTTLNPDLAVFVLVRDPLQHAYSLMQQHIKFSAQQDDDPFIKEYMDWLGHHEFGHGQRPFILNGLGRQDGDPNDINYWLERWINYYTRIDLGTNVFILTYEKFLAQPSYILESISNTIGIHLNLENIEVFDKAPASVNHVNEALLSEANALYAKLQLNA